MKELYYVYSTTMSPGNQGVFQLLKEVNYLRVIVFFTAFHIHIKRIC